MLRGARRGVFPPRAVTADLTEKQGSLHRRALEKIIRNLKTQCNEVGAGIISARLVENGDKHNKALHKSSSQSIANTNKSSAPRSSRKSVESFYSIVLWAAGWY